jgi:16S rRNA C1402 (ribose-2'-O) methylase RsmI
MHETAAAPNPPSQHGFLGFLSRKKHGRKKRKKKTEKTTDPELQTIKSCKIKTGLSSFCPSFFDKRTKLIACEAHEPDILDCGYK